MGTCFCGIERDSPAAQAAEPRECGTMDMGIEIGRLGGINSHPRRRPIKSFKTAGEDSQSHSRSEAEVGFA